LIDANPGLPPPLSEVQRREFAVGQPSRAFIDDDNADGYGAASMVR
jgi:hypothetical protein